MSVHKDRAGREWIRTSPEIQRQARELRKQMTPAERALWKRLRGGAVRGLGFRRQHPYGPFIFDFFCPHLKLVIELDGAIHADPTQREHDEARDAQCQAYDLTVLRYANDEAIKHPESIIAAIEAIYQHKTGGSES